MLICEWCENEFSRDDAESEFECATRFAYSNLRKCLCGSCAIKAIEDLDDGIYFETCENCDCVFDLAKERAKYNRHFDWSNGIELEDLWDDQILCAECAIEELDKRSHS